MESGGIGIHYIADIWNIQASDIRYTTNYSACYGLVNSLIATTKMTAVGPLQFHPFPVRLAEHRPDEPNHCSPLLASQSFPLGDALCQEFLESPLFLSDGDLSLDPPISPPPVVAGDLSSPGGYSAIQVLGESHISLHTYPSASAISLDIFSCRFFPADAVSDYLNETFKNSKNRIVVLPRSFK